jgi:hypothetical protein
MPRRRCPSKLTDQTRELRVRLGRYRPANILGRSQTPAKADDRIDRGIVCSLVIGTPTVFRQLGVQAAVASLRRLIARDKTAALFLFFDLG